MTKGVNSSKYETILSSGDKDVSMPMLLDKRHLLRSSMESTNNISQECFFCLFMYLDCYYGLYRIFTFFYLIESLYYKFESLSIRHCWIQNINLAHIKQWKLESHIQTHQKNGEDEQEGDGRKTE